MDIRKTIGRKIRSARIQAQLSQEELADVSGFSQQYISELETGKRNPTIASLQAICAALNKSVGFLFLD